MEQERPSYLEQVSQEHWEKTPASVKKLVESMAGGIEKLERQVVGLLEVQQHLSEQVNRTSLNSSSPPQATHLDLGRNQARKKAVKSGEVNRVMRVKVGTYIQ